MGVAALAQAVLAVECGDGGIAQKDSGAVGIDAGNLAFFRHADAGQLVAGSARRPVGGHFKVDQRSRGQGRIDGDGRRAGNRIDRDHLKAGARGIDHIPILIDRKSAVAGEAHLIVAGALHGEEAFAGDGEVQRLVGSFDGSLRELLGDALHAHALTGNLRGRLHRCGGEDVPEYGLALLEGG